MKRIFGFSLALAALAAVIIAATAPATTPATGGIQIGDKAPDFKLKGVDGKTYSLADLKDANGKAPKGYIVTFTCNTCPFAVLYEDRIIALNKKTSIMGYPVVAIQPNDPALKPGDDFAAMQQRAKEKNFTFPYLFDDGQKVFPQYGASRTPEFYVLDKDMVLRYTGAMDDNAEDPAAVKVNYIEMAIKYMENNQAPNPATTKAIGCSIKVKKS